MKYKEFILDRFQEEAIAALDRNCSVVVSAPTGSGKTLIADYVINRDLRMDKKIIYTAPIKALSNQKYKDFSLDFGEDNVGLLTGDLVINPTAPVLVMTTEVYRNMLMV
ncbi:helicase, partial [Candidatus Woesearchaeota archaeon CG10_big_fil_rev_8_21_14_0_10_47_5]